MGNISRICRVRSLRIQFYNSQTVKFYFALGLSRVLLAHCIRSKPTGRKNIVFLTVGR